MQTIKSHKAKRAAAMALLLIASIAMAACGSSSGKTATTTAKAAASGPARFTALRECLKKEGITLPTAPNGRKRPNGAPPSGGGFLPGGGGGTGGRARRLPNGVSRSKFEAAFKKCGGSAGSFGGGRRLGSAGYKKSLASFATCMRQNGVQLPVPNTTGKGPIFNTKGIDTASAKFKSARSKCDSLLATARPGAGGSGQGGAPGAAPPGQG
jgi:hypothetical protein